ncbi:MAG: hypothetical protein PVJ83_00110 [Gammaproteobacteria bacterium]|jgi:hypothetical protein
MLEYIFFHRQALNRFSEYLAEAAVAYEISEDEMGLVAAVPDDLEPRIIEQIDAVYEQLLDESENLLSEEDATYTAALNIKLNDGRTIAVSVAPELLNRILSVISFEELNQLLDAIVSGIENPDDRPLCQR